MTKRKLFIRAVIMIILVALLIPAFVTRVENESRNNDVIFALNYNNAEMVLSEEELGKSLRRNRENGVTTLLVAEESLNSLINAGYVTAIKYNTLCHKYDDESEALIKQIGDNKKIHNDSYVIITKRQDVKEYLAKWIPSKFNKNEYLKLTTPLNADVYVLYEDIIDTWKLTTGFNEDKLKNAKKQGYEIALSMILGAHSNTKYVEYVGQLVDEYDIRFINLKADYNDEEKSKYAANNYNAFCDLIEEKNLNLILTENQTQLSNQKPIGHDELVKSAEGKILRSYETVDYGNEDLVKTRYYQIVNSVIDRNIRFVVINQLTSGLENNKAKNDKTDEATKMAIEKLNDSGYNNETYNMVYDYEINVKMTHSIAMVLMVLMCLSIVEWVFGVNLKKLVLCAYAAAVLCIGFTFIAPESILNLYPTLFAVIAPCFGITAMLEYVKVMRKKLSYVKFAVSAALLTIVLLSLLGVVQSVLLAGIEYYINIKIFRGIKLSLLLPTVYALVAFAVMFAENDIKTYLTKDKISSCFANVIEFLKKDIKVYWLIVVGAVCFVAVTYITRSGNVTEISAFESLMRNTVTDIMTIRPRTKEFLVAWPCLALFFYYVKNTDWKIIQWALAVGSSILFASVVNSFCHVFTAASIIYTRCINGLVIGIIISAVLLFVNRYVVKLIRFVLDKILHAGNSF